MELLEYIDKAKENKIIVDSIAKADLILNHKGYKNIWCSVSGGADSDILIDICTKLNPNVQYVFFNTGIEYRATLEHLDYLEQKYNIKIERVRGKENVPWTCKYHGEPFLSKFISETIERLQKHGFQWEDEPYEILVKKYPKCKSAIMWWTNYRPVLEGYKHTMFNINYTKGLKEFLIQNPPQFKISNKCCNGAKKKPAKHWVKDNNVDLMILGIRRAEGGVRSMNYKNCYSELANREDQYRPLFWYKNSDRKEYEEIFEVKHSKCYSDYGFKRTGCSCCPFSRELENELQIIKDKEPQIYKAVNNIFHNSYEYTRRFRKFQEEMKIKERHE